MMKKMKSALAGAVAVAGALTVQATSLTDAYVQDGLVVFWDAIENQGPGQPHSNTPTAWLDATGHGYGLGPYLTLAQPVWTDDGCVFPDSAYTTKTALGCSTGALLLPAGTAPHTLEFIADAPVVGSKQAGIITLTQTPLTSSAPAGDINFRTAESQIYCRFTSKQFATGFRQANQVTPENGSFAVAMSRDEAGDVWWHYQGRKYAKVATGSADTYGAISNVLIGAMSGSAAFEAGFTGTVHAVRLYSRALSDREMELNARLDRQRYHGGEVVARIADDEVQWKTEVSVLAGTGTLSLDGCEATSSVEQWLAAEGEPVTLTAIPAKGFAFVAWSGDVDGLTDEQQESATVQLPRGLPRKIWATFSEDVDASYHASDYVQDGLVIQFDALENAGARRYLPDPDVWRDLTGNGQDATARTGNNRPSWTGNAACTTNAFGKQAGFTFVPCTATLDAANGKTPFTMQYCATSPTVGNGTYMFGLSGGSTFGFRYTGADGTAYYQVRGSQTSIAKYAETLAGQTDTVYLKGTTLYRYVDKAYKTSNAANIGTGTLTGGGYLLSPSVNSIVNLHAVRFYNRVLTPFEIAHNARLDRVRFKGDADETRVYTVTPEGDVACGTSTPAYTGNTATESAKGAVIAFSLTGLSTDGFDGQRNVLLETGVRDRFLGWRANGGATNAAESVDYALDDDTDFRWVFVREYFQDYSSAEGGTIAHDGVGCAAYSAWCPTGQVVRLTAVPDEDHVFFAWTGTLDGLSGQEKNSALDVLVDRPRTIRAVFRAKTHTPRTATWTGGSTASATDWDDAANWDGEVPGEGDDVVFGSAKTARTIILSHETPVFNSIVIDSQNTLMTSNWFTKIQATTVTVKNGGVITCGDAFKDSQMSNRVWIVCQDLDVQSGGTINVNDKGWRGGNGPSRPSGYAGGAHGGYGAKPSNASSCTQWNALPYGDAESPLDPGEGGSHGTYNGGGAVLVEASGMVTIGGAVKASATKSTFSARSGLGSGGSICIRSKRFKGTGSLTADGAYGQSNWNAAEQNNSSEYSHPGGGGYISVKYDPTVETDDDVNGMTISAAAGDLYIRYNSSSGKASYHRTPAHADDFRQDAGIGQLWFTDNRMLKGSLGSKMTGALVYTNRFEFDSLTVTSGHVRFGAEGCQVNVAGDLVVSGKLARVEIGGYMATNRSTGVELYAGKVAPKLTVGGCLAVADEARLDVRAAETNGVEAYGAWVDVAGHFRIASNSYVYAWCDSFNGGAPRFTAKSLTVETNGVFSADRRGFAAGSNRDGSSGTARCPVAGRGPGGGWPVSSGSLHGGGGHGGAGGLFGESGMGTTGMTNDFNVARPSLAGSGGGSNVAYGSAGHGGGVISVAVERDLVVHGKVTANGGGLKQYTGGAGAGGTILLEGKTFSGTGSLAANGEIGSRTSNGTKISGCGGGGRIAVWTGKSWIEGKSRMKHCTVSETPVTGMTFSGTATAAGGIHPYSDAYNGKDGTVRYVWYDGAPGMLLFVR